MELVVNKGRQQHDLHAAQVMAASEGYVLHDVRDVSPLKTGFFFTFVSRLQCFSTQLSDLLVLEMVDMRFQ